MIHKSPCRSCFREVSNEEYPDAGKTCIRTCVDLACWQKAYSIAEKVGLPKHGQCAICRDPDMEQYCHRCRDKVEDEIKKRSLLIKEQKPQPKKQPDGPYKYRMITKQKPGKCEWCGDYLLPGETVMARRSGRALSYYRYACPLCADEHRQVERSVVA